MIAAKYNKALIDREFIRSLAEETATDIYRVQASIASTEKKSGETYRYLSQRPFVLTTSGTGVTLTLNYLGRMRFRDLRKTKTGAAKQNYTPLYNKIVWSFIYGYLYKQLMYGITQQMNEAITQRLQSAGYKHQ